jgi:hypothetical protein
MEKFYSVVIAMTEAISDFCIARFNSNGTLDTTFGSSGKVIQPIGSGDDEVSSIAIQSDGKILLGGYCSNGSNTISALHALIPMELSILLLVLAVK